MQVLENDQLGLRQQPFQDVGLGMLMALAAADPGGIRSGSNKSLLGHSAWSSGVVSVVELLMALRQETIPAQRRFTEPEPEPEPEPVVGTGKGVEVPVSDIPWPRDGRRPRVGGVSAFGFGGTNAHLLIADRVPAKPDRSAGEVGGFGHQLVRLDQGHLKDDAGLVRELLTVGGTDRRLVDDP